MAVKYSPGHPALLLRQQKTYTFFLFALLQFELFVSLLDLWPRMLNLHLDLNKTGVSKLIRSIRNVSTYRRSDLVSFECKYKPYTDLHTTKIDYVNYIDFMLWNCFLTGMLKRTPCNWIFRIMIMIKTEAVSCFLFLVSCFLFLSYTFRTLVTLLFQFKILLDALYKRTINAIS